VLEGPLADRARDAIAAIARDVGRISPAPASSLEARLPYSLAYGQAGVSLFFSYLAASCQDAGAADQARATLEESLIALAEVDMTPDLFRGLAGIGWVFSHTRDWLWARDAEEDTEADSSLEIDSLLAEWAGSAPLAPELMHGLAGLCLYALERLPEGACGPLLDAAVASLRGQARSLPQGVAWSFPQRAADAYFADHERHAAEGRGIFDREELRQVLARGMYKVGAAHGAAGVASALAAVHAAGAGTPATLDLVDGAVRWLLAQRLAGQEASLFPEVVGLGRPQSQSGWCNGDLGVAAALFNTAQAAARDDWRETALEIARREARKGVAEVEVLNRANPILCHGHAGRAHLFNRLFQATGEAPFLQASRYWFEEVLRLRQGEGGYGGFFVDEAGKRFAVRGFLMGSAGIGLALLAGVTDQEPAWDRVLGVSLPQIRQGA
jgi:lantibiotic modifying enzyme